MTRTEYVRGKVASPFGFISALGSVIAMLYAIITHGTVPNWTQNYVGGAIIHLVSIAVPTCATVLLLALVLIMEALECGGPMRLVMAAGMVLLSIVTIWGDWHLSVGTVHGLITALFVLSVVNFCTVLAAGRVTQVAE